MTSQTREIKLSPCFCARGFRNFSGQQRSIVRTIFEAEAEPSILPSASDRAEEAQTRILPLAIKNCPDY